MRRATPTDTSDRVATRTDPLTHSASYQYDGNSNLTQATDRERAAAAHLMDPFYYSIAGTAADDWFERLAS